MLITRLYQRSNKKWSSNHLNQSATKLTEPSQLSRIQKCIPINAKSSFSILCSLPTWWLWRGGCTRSHTEHGRETPQRRWYFVSRRGRVGHRQVCQAQRISSHHNCIKRRHGVPRAAFLRSKTFQTHKRPVVIIPFATGHDRINKRNRPQPVCQTV